MPDTGNLPQVSVVIVLPLDNAALVGQNPGAQVEIQGTLTVGNLGYGIYTFPQPASVTIKFGASDQPRLATITGAPNSTGYTLNWFYFGTLPTGGAPIQVLVHANVPWSWDSGDPHNRWHVRSSTDADAKPITLALSSLHLDVQSPKDGEVFVGSPNGTTITATGTASADTGGGIWQLWWGIDGGRSQQVVPFVSPFSFPMQIPLGYHVLGFVVFDHNGNNISQVISVQVALPQDVFQVGPLSYLKALVEFATAPFNNNTARIVTDSSQQHNLTLNLIDNTFHQSIADILDPNYEAKASEPLNPTRISIEVLRRYLVVHPPSAGQDQILLQKESAFLAAAYQSLLQQVGTSYNEIRLARTYDRANPLDSIKLQSIADRLELQLLAGRPDELDRLFFDVSAAPRTPGALSEGALEQFFGLVDTTRDPFSQGSVSADPQTQVVRWSLDGLSFLNTDGDGLVYLTLKQTAGPNYAVSVSADSAGNQVLATGTSPSAKGAVRLAQVGSSGVSGLITINYQADTVAPIVLSAFPHLLAWQRRRLRSDWAFDSSLLTPGPIVADPGQQIVRWNLSGLSFSKNTDANGFVYLTVNHIAGPGYVVDVYSDQARTQLIASGNSPNPTGTVVLAQANASGVSGTITLNYQADTSLIALSLLPSTRPCVDPDLLTDADFSSPSNPAHVLYETRKALVAGWFNTIKSQRETAATPLIGLNAILGTVLKDVQYYPNGMTVDDVSALDDSRQNGEDISAVLTALAIDANAFNYLVRTCPLVKGGVPLLQGEWEDIYSILVQVQKRRALFTWVAEEQNKSIILGPDCFRFPVSLPRLFATGVDGSGVPLADGAVDPHWSITSTPAGAPGTAYVTAAGASAFPIGQAWLRNSSVSRWISPQADESTGDAPGYYTYRTIVDLGGYDASTVWLTARIGIDNALTAVRLNTIDLGLSARGFATFQNLEINGVFQSGINTLDFVVKNEGTSTNPSGLRVELSFGAPPLTSSLSAWRATPAARRAWEALLSGRIRQDGALETDLQGALDLTEKQTLHGLKDAMLAAVSTNADGIDTLHSTGSQFAKDPNTSWFFDLNWVITGVHPGQTDRAYIPSPPNAAWLANDQFSSWIAPSGVEDSGPGDSPGNYTYTTNFDLNAVELGSVRIALQAAVDNTITDVLLNGHSLGLSANGFAALSPLAIAAGFVAGANTLDIIVNNAGAGPNPSGLRVQASLSASMFVDADWVASALLIDVKQTSEQTTTRLQQATEMMQALFFALRNYEFKKLSPAADPSPWTLTEAPHLFDQEWETMGTYATWIAAMLAFLYPENLLFPTLRLPAAAANHEPQAPWEKTTQFDVFVSSLSQATPLTPAKAVEIASAYILSLNTAGYADLPVELHVTPGQAWYQDPRDVDAAALSATWRPVILNYLNNKKWIQLAFIWEACYSVAIQIALELQKTQQFEAALAWFGIVYAYFLPLVGGAAGWTDDQRQIFPLKLLEGSDNNFLQVPTWTVHASNPHQVAVTRAYPYTRYINLSIIECLLDFADAQFTTHTTESLSNARSLFEYSLELLAQLEAIWPAVPVLEPNHRLRGLRIHAENNLAKLRAGRNIAGLIRQTQNDASTMSVSLQPSAYRYLALIDRAKQIAQLAQQVESSYLASLQKGEDEAYSALRAKQDLESANGTTKLETLKLTEASDSVALAQDQRQRAQIQANHYTDLLSSDILGLEIMAVGLHGMAAAASAIPTQGGAGAALSSSAAAVNETASIEEKQKDWEHQLDLANQDLTIGHDQVVIANDNLAIASQDLLNADMQANHASATATFLANKFTNADLYKWMSGVLGAVYSYFLRQATATAKLAEAQLAFERQEKTLSLIQPDYWRPLTGPTYVTTDRRGLTGSERLLADITQLDQFALDTDRRRLQLTKIISLSRLDPIAFAKFLQSGALRFSTTMALFDNDFPGHYVRTIKQVRLSVVALIPPTQGIRASLANAGISRVITTDDVGSFVPVIVRRDPQIIALSSPSNATGLFDLAAQSSMLLPFEDLGVDTSWEFLMPRSSNPFDFNTIADVQLAIDYTALDSADYRQQMIQQMGSSVSADRAYSFRQQFADAWYFLNNSQQSTTPMKVQFETTLADFPPNVDPSTLTIAQLVMYFMPADGAKFPVTATLSLSGTDAVGNPATTSGQATSTDQIISTRRGARAWTSLIGMGTTGKWELDLSNPDMSGLFKNQQIQDIILVISYSGQTPPWPS